MAAQINRTPTFHAPTDLSATQTRVTRALVVGSCFAEGFAERIGQTFPGAELDFVLFNHATTLTNLPRPMTDYDFQVTILPLRSLAPETAFFPLSWKETDAFEKQFAWSADLLNRMLETATGPAIESGIPTFVANLLTPQANSMGRLLPSLDLRNPAYYVRCLNDIVAKFCDAHANIHLLNADELAASIGRRNFQDDIVVINSHGTYISDWDYQHDRARLELPTPLKDRMEMRAEEFVHGLWAEVRAMLRTIRQQDSVKIVICDLDDTLWRGVLAEGDQSSPLMEGWPIGLIEALTYLKRRGVLLAIASKNTEEVIRGLWDRSVGKRLPMSAFSVVKINWKPKAENIEAILQEANLLARNALFIDDNPVERDLAKKAFPELRTLGADLYSIRRILMWAPELQVAQITDESVRRTAMVQSQIEREKSRSTLSREDFLRSLEIRVAEFPVRGADDPRFNRAFELINKSNQFNTNGERWSLQEAKSFFAAGGVFDCFEVEDKFTNYGLVAVAVVLGDTLKQYVMSCRVLGLDVEIAILGRLARAAVPKYGSFAGRIVETSANMPCRDCYERAGFVFDGGDWRVEDIARLPPAGHVNWVGDAESEDLSSAERADASAA